MPFCGRVGKEGNAPVSLFRGNFELIYFDGTPRTAGPDNISTNITPLGGPGGCQGSLQYFYQDTKESAVKKGFRCSPFALLKCTVCQRGDRGDRSGMVQLVPSQTSRG